MKKQEYVQVPTEWLETINALAVKVQVLVDESDATTKRVIGEVGVPYLMGYLSSIKTILKHKNNQP